MSWIDIMTIGDDPQYERQLNLMNNEERWRKRFPDGSAEDEWHPGSPPGADAPPTIAEMLYHTPYFVMPRLALEAMPKEWQRRFELLIDEMAKAGISTPAYYVFRDDNLSPPGMVRNVALDRGEHDPMKAWFVFMWHTNEDPWANYRRGNIKEICPTFKGESK